MSNNFMAKNNIVWKVKLCINIIEKNKKYKHLFCWWWNISLDLDSRTITAYVEIIPRYEKKWTVEFATDGNTRVMNNSSAHKQKKCYLTLIVFFSSHSVMFIYNLIAHFGWSVCRFASLFSSNFQYCQDLCNSKRYVMNLVLYCENFLWSVQRQRITQMLGILDPFCEWRSGQIVRLKTNCCR